MINFDIPEFIHLIRIDRPSFSRKYFRPGAKSRVKPKFNVTRLTMIAYKWPSLPFSHEY